MYHPYGTGERYATVVHQLGKLGMVHRILHRRALEEYTLHPGQLPILEYIHENPGCTQVEIAQTLFITPSSIAQSTKRMQREGLLQKVIRDENQRSKQLYLTDKGREAAHACRSRFDELDHALFATFSEEELDTLEDYLNRMLRSAGELVGLDTEHLEFDELHALKTKALQRHGGHELC